MTAAVLLDGKALAARVLDALRGRVAVLAVRGVQPKLMVVRVGDDPASKAYIRGKIRACKEVGIAGNEIELPAAATATEIYAVLADLNGDKSVHGVLVQLPLPAHLDAHEVAARIHPDKDVDGLHPQNLGRLVQARASFVPCTPAGVLRILSEYGIALAGRHAVVVGRSEIVGRPMALELIARDATVTVCNSKTPDLGRFTRDADVLVVAVGRPGLIHGTMVKPGAAVIDVGINRTADGRLVGDVEATSVGEQAGYLTPVPGGVGPMTVAMLMENTVKAAERTTG